MNKIVLAINIMNLEKDSSILWDLLNSNILIIWEANTLTDQNDLPVLAPEYCLYDGRLKSKKSTKKKNGSKSSRRSKKDKKSKKYRKSKLKSESSSDEDD